MSIRKITRQELQSIVEKGKNLVAAADRDEMAIPSYLHWNPLIRWLVWRRYEVIAVLAGFKPDMTVLEFGCGPGMFLPELSARCRTVYAVDLFPQYARELCRRKKLPVQFSDSVDAVSDSSLDLVIAAQVLEHMEKDELIRYLDLFSRKLKPEGRLLLSGPTENFAYKIGRILAGFGGKGDYHHSNADTVMDTVSCVFVLKRIRTLPFFFPPYLYKVCEYEPSSAGLQTNSASG